MGGTVKADCAYCINLEEQGALCDHPCHLYAGEPTNAKCGRCKDYEKRQSVVEMRERIHNLEALLEESEKWRGMYAGQVIQLKSESARLRDLVTEMHGWMSKVVCRGEWPEFEYEDVCEKMRQLGIEVE